MHNAPGAVDMTPNQSPGGGSPYPDGHPDDGAPPHLSADHSIGDDATSSNGRFCGGDAQLTTSGNTMSKTMTPLGGSVTAVGNRSLTGRDLPELTLPPRRPSKLENSVRSPAHRFSTVIVSPTSRAIDGDPNHHTHPAGDSPRISTQQSLGAISFHAHAPGTGRSSQRSGGHAHTTGQDAVDIVVTGADELERDRIIALIDSSLLSWRHRWFCILEGVPNAEDEHAAIVFNMTSAMVVVASCVIFCWQSMPSEVNSAKGTNITTDALFWSDLACVVVFASEALLRVVCVPWSHLWNAFFVIDVIIETGYLSSVSVVFRLFRIFRVFKLSRYSKSLQLVLMVLKNSISGLSMLVMPLLLVAIICASLIYFFEVLEATWSPAHRAWLSDDGRHIQFQSVPEALWFTFATIATVGYGDRIPSALASRFIAVFLMFVGVLTLSFPNIVLGANLQIAFRQQKRQIARQYLAKKFRRVRLIVGFIRRCAVLVDIRRQNELLQQQRAERAAERLAADPAAISVQQPTAAGFFEAGNARPNAFFFLAEQDFLSVERADVERITPDSVRGWAHGGVKAIEVMQLVLEVFSGVALADDVHRHLLDLLDGAPGAAHADFVLAVLYMADAGFFRVYVLTRQPTQQMVLALTSMAVTELRLHPEHARLTCLQTSEYARFVWKQTTGEQVPFTLSILASAYPTWWRNERTATLPDDGRGADLRTLVSPRLQDQDGAATPGFHFGRSTGSNPDPNVGAAAGFRRRRRSTMVETPVDLGGGRSQNGTPARLSRRGSAYFGTTNSWVAGAGGAGVAPTRASQRQLEALLADQLRRNADLEERVRLRTLSNVA
jgi:hypothetical protein